MQEYSLPIVKTLTQGLRPRNDVGRPGEFLSQCQAMMPIEFGLRSCTAVANPFDEALAVSWPFPQLLRGSCGTLLAYEKAIYPVTESSTNPWSIGSVYTTYDLNNPSDGKSILAGGRWHMADLGGGWLLSNGVSTVFKLSLGSMFGEADYVYVQDVIPVASACAFRGRIILGGISPLSLFSDDWKAIWEQWLGALPYAIDIDVASPRNNCVYWSTIGGGDALLPFAPELIMDGLMKEDEAGTKDENFFLELFKRNELGFMPMPWQGDIYVVKELGKGVAVYGEDGIAVLSPVVEPYPTFGLQVISDVGISGRDAVGGDWRRHILRDRAGNIWSLDASYNLRKLDYNEFAGALGDEIAISHNPVRDEFYISDDEAAYILTPKGLGQSHQVVTSTCHVNDNLYGIFDDDESTEAIVVTDTIDFNQRDFKTITTVEVGADAGADETIYVAADYRYAKNESWERTAWRKLNKQGFARLQITAMDFRIAVKCTSYVGFKIDYINVRWQPSAKRTIRGMYAGTPNA